MSTATKDVYWLGDSRDILRSFPEEVKDEAGYRLAVIQRGGMPPHVKPLAHLGKGIHGVIEIIIDQDKETYRVVTFARLRKGVYVLHAFHKKSKSGIGIPPKDRRLIIQRYKDALDHDRS